MLPPKSLKHDLITGLMLFIRTHVTLTTKKKEKMNISFWISALLSVLSSFMHRIYCYAFWFPSHPRS